MIFQSQTSRKSLLLYSSEQNQPVLLVWFSISATQGILCSSPHEGWKKHVATHIPLQTFPWVTVKSKGRGKRTQKDARNPTMPWNLACQNLWNFASKRGCHLRCCVGGLRALLPAIRCLRGFFSPGHLQGAWRNFAGAKTNKGGRQAGSILPLWVCKVLAQPP